MFKKTGLLLLGAVYLALSLGAGESVPFIHSTIIKAVQLQNVKTPDGENAVQLTFTVPRSELLYPPHLQYPFPMKGLKNGDKIRLSFWIKGKKGCRIDFRVTEIVPYSNHYSETLKRELSGEWQKMEHVFTLKELAVEAYCAMPRLIFADFTHDSPILVGPMQAVKLEK